MSAFALRTALEYNLPSVTHPPPTKRGLMSTPNPAPLRAILLAQAPIKHDLRRLDSTLFCQLAACFDGVDVCFTDVEGVLTCFVGLCADLGTQITVRDTYAAFRT
jgi:hypothetical protein